MAYVVRESPLTCAHCASKAFMPIQICRSALTSFLEISPTSRAVRCSMADMRRTAASARAASAH
eukprot:7508119-Pyramimonas_sp.AAC.1